MAFQDSSGGQYERSRSIFRSILLDQKGFVHRKLFLSKDSYRSRDRRWGSWRENFLWISIKTRRSLSSWVGRTFLAVISGCVFGRKKSRRFPSSLNWLFVLSFTLFLYSLFSSCRPHFFYHVCIMMISFKLNSSIITPLIFRMLIDWNPMLSDKFLSSRLVVDFPSLTTN